MDDISSGCLKILINFRVGIKVSHGMKLSQKNYLMLGIILGIKVDK